MSLGSFFGGIFSTAGTAVGGFFSSVRAYLIVAVVVLFVVLAGSFYWYYNWSQAKLQLDAVNQTKLEDAINQQKSSFDQLKKDSDNLVKSYQDLQQKQNEVQKQNDLLSRKIQQYDFQKNAITNHDATEKTINDQTDQMLKNFEKLSDPNNLTSPGDRVIPTPSHPKKIIAAPPSPKKGN